MIEVFSTLIIRSLYRLPRALLIQCFCLLLLFDSYLSSSKALKIGCHFLADLSGHLFSWLLFHSEIIGL
jgi:hypothetical protein